MTIAEADIFEKDGAFLFTDIPDGLAVNDADGQEIHFLNHVAATVLLLCDGDHDVRSIALILQEEFGLPESPLQDLRDCLAERLANGIIRKLM